MKDIKNMTKAELVAEVERLQKLVPTPGVAPADALGRFVVAWDDDPESTVVGLCANVGHAYVNAPYWVACFNRSGWYSHARLATPEEVEGAGFVMPVSGGVK